MRSRSPPPPPNRCSLRLVRVAFGSIRAQNRVWVGIRNTFGLACDSSLILISPSTTSCGRSEHNLCLLLPQNSTSCGFLIHFLPQVVLFYHNLCSVFYHNLCSFLPQVVLSRILRKAQVVLFYHNLCFENWHNLCFSTTTCGRSDHNL